MKLTSDNLTLSILPVKTATSAGILVGLDCGKVNSQLFCSLKNGSPIYACGEEDLTAVYFTIYEQVCSKLTGNAQQSLTTDISCGANIHDGELAISVVCPSKASAVGKCLGIVMKNLCPSSNFSRYSYHMKALGLKPDRDAFNWAVGEVCKCLEKKLNIVLTGKFKLDGKKDMWQKKLDTVSKKLVVKSVDKGNKRNVSCEKQESNLDTLKASGLEGVMVKKYIDNGLGMDLHLESGKLYYPTKFGSRVSGMNNPDRIEKFVDGATRRFKNNEELTNALVHEGIRTNGVSVSSALKGGITSKGLESAIKKAF